MGSSYIHILKRMCIVIECKGKVVHVLEGIWGGGCIDPLVIECMFIKCIRSASTFYDVVWVIQGYSQVRETF
jgi:hypothetical protein